MLACQVDHGFSNLPDLSIRGLSSTKGFAGEAAEQHIVMGCSVTLQVLLR